MIKSLLTGLLAALSVAGAAERPNFVLIFVDDMGWGDPGYQGGSLTPTPAIDGLAHSGVRFSDGYVAAPVCSPSRHGLMAGAYQQRFGMQWNHDRRMCRIPEGHLLLPEALRAAGYATGLVGKWNVNRDPAAVFDEVHDLMDWEADYWPDENGHYVGLGPNEFASGKIQGVWGPERPGDEYLTDRLGRHAVGFVERHRDRPFFLYLAFGSVHSPWHGKSEHRKRFATLAPGPMPFYASMMISLDETVGRVLEAIRAAGVESNTVVAFLSDNGPARSDIRGIPPDWPKDLIVGSTGGLNGWKAQYLEGGIRVPFALRWPGRIRPGTEYRRPVSAMDLYATFCAGAGVPIPAETRLDGANLLPFLDGSTGGDPHDELFWMHDGEGAVRRGDWKLVVSRGGEKFRLFDLAADQAESRDLAATKPDVAKDLLAAWVRWSATMPPAANSAAREKGPPPKSVAEPVVGIMGIQEITTPGGAPFNAFTVTTADGIEFLLLYRLARDHLNGRKPAEVVGQTVRIRGEAEQSGRSGRFSSVTSFEFLP